MEFLGDDLLVRYAMSPKEVIRLDFTNFNPLVGIHSRPILKSPLSFNSGASVHDTKLGNVWIVGESLTNPNLLRSGKPKPSG